MHDNPAICERRVIRVGGGGEEEREQLDRLAVEGPLEVRVRGEPAVVLMRTPGDDEELVTGYLLGEAFAASAAAIGAMIQTRGGAETMRGDVLDLPEAELLRDVRATRSLYSSTACGACGKAELGELATQAAPISSGLEVSAEVIARLPARLRAEQAAFEETGGLHAAGAFDASGALLAAREDVGRHNAVDKLVGWAARAGALPMSEAILCVSGRLSFELVQKAIAAGFPVVAAVSAPSSLAVDLAERYRVTLCGFVRQGRFNLYAHPCRILSNLARSGRAP